MVPYYHDILVTAGNVESYNESHSNISYVNLGDAFNDATGALQVSGHSMYPTYENGSIVGYREVIDKGLILYGEVYILGTKDYQIIKRVQKNSKKGFILVTSDNVEDRSGEGRRYEPFDIAIDKIIFLALVLGKISRNQMKLIRVE